MVIMQVCKEEAQGAIYSRHHVSRLPVLHQLAPTTNLSNVVFTTSINEKAR